MIRKAPALLLILFWFIPFSEADAPPAEVARQVKVYIYRPGVFADQYVGLGIPTERAPLEGHLWYIHVDQSVHALLTIESLSQFIRDSAIPGLDFTNDRILSTGEMERLLQPGLEHLRLLKTAGTPLDDVVLPSIGNLYDLEVLELNDRVTDRGVSWLRNLRNLRVLAVKGANVTDQSISTLAQLTQLERLGLKGTQITDKGIEKLVGLPLRALELGAASTDRSLEALSGVQTLQQLDLSLAHITGKGLSALSKVAGIHTLFLGPSVTDADVASLGAFKNLKRLDLTGAYISDAAADLLGHMDQLEELALTKTQVTKATLQKLQRLPHLRYLEISETRIEPSDFAQVTPFPALQVISFSSTRRVHAGDVRVFGAWPRVHSLLINGVLLGPELVNYLRTSRRSERRPAFIAEAEAASASEGDIENALEVASAPTEEPQAHRFAGIQGLPRIHEAEASLEDVTPAVSNPTIDTFQENEKNFLGEFTVGAATHKKKKKSNSE